MRTRSAFIACFVMVCVFITWQELKDCGELPFPTRFIATAVVFGMLDLASGFLGTVPLLVGVGLTLAQFICTAHPTKACQNRFTGANCQARLAVATSQPSDFQVLQGGTQVGPGETLA